MIYGGFDLSISSAGWAVWNTGWPLPLFGTWELAGSVKHAARAWVRLQKNMMGLVNEHGQFDVVAIEETVPAFQMKGKTSYRTVKALSGLEAHALSFAEATGARWHLISIGAWRADFLGRNIPSDPDWKHLAMVRCRQMGMHPAVHDAAEAIGILTYQILSDGLTPPWCAAETLRPILGEVA